VNVFDTVDRFIHVAGLAATCPLVSSISGDGDVTLLCQLLCIKASDLFLYATIGMRVFLLFEING